MRKRDLPGRRRRQDRRRREATTRRGRSPSAADVAGGGGEGEQLSVAEPRPAAAVRDEGGEKEMVGERRGRPTAAVGVVAPAHAAGGRVERIEPPVESLLEDAAVADDGRELEQSPAVERPDASEGRPEPSGRNGPKPRVVSSVRRPRQGRAHRRRPGLGRGRDRRRRRRDGLRPAAPAGDERAGRSRDQPCGGQTPSHCGSPLRRLQRLETSRETVGQCALAPKLIAPASNTVDRPRW
jgi:hypothetical protein